jgi:ribosomal protein L25 (general stress protein Ctc)
MKSLKKILALAILLSGGAVLAQPSFYDLTFKADSTTNPYASDNNNYVFIRSKRGSEPVKPTSSGDSIKGFKIPKIVLVFSELNPSDVETREEYNQERWENLMATYPEFFQDKTVYKNVCQCSRESGNPEFKQVQGFYIYFTPKGNVIAKTEPAKPVSTAVAKEEPKKEVPKEEPKKEVTKAEPAKKEEPKKEEPKKEVVKAEPAKKEEPKKEAAREEPKKETPVVQPVTTAVAPEEPKKAVVVADEETDESADVKKVVSSAPRRAKDPKACRQACYGTGESDLNAYFRDNVVLTKKMKKDEVDLKIQLNVDGTVKKVIILGDNADLNKLVEDAAKKMVWNASVKSGLTIKSEVRMKLKFDKELKGLKANELMVNPRLGPKCLTCTSDAELQLK